MRILMSCYACLPNRGSEPGVGWHWAQMMSASHDVWVLTRSWQEEEIEKALRVSPNPNLHFIYLDLPTWFPRRNHRSAIAKLHYVLWQFVALRRAREYDRVLDFDLVHHVTFNGIDVPGLLYRLGKPFVLGPLGGGQVTPSVLLSEFGRRRYAESLKSFRKRHVRLIPGVKRAIRSAAFVFVANEDTEIIVRQIRQDGVVRLLEAGRPLPNAPKQTPREGGSINLVWIGELIPRKAPSIAVDSLRRAVSRGIAATLTVIGSGPLYTELAQKNSDLIESGHLRLLGSQSHDDVLTYLTQSDALLFTSLNDTSGNVILEAMEHCLPVIALNHQGAAEILDDHCALLIPIERREAVVEAIALAICELAWNSSRREQMGIEGRNRLERLFTWERKAPLVNNIYAQSSRT